MQKSVLRRTACLAAGVVVAAMMVSARTGAQAPPDMQKLAAAFEQAWAKGDAKGLAALHTADAMRLSPDGQVAVGRAAIEQSFADAFAGPFKGSKLSIKSGQTKRVSGDVYVNEGTYAVSGVTLPPGVPSAGRYFNTVVQQGGQLLLASSATQSTPAAPSK